MEPLQVAIIGCGGYAGAHARRLKARPDVRIAALCSRTEASISRLIERRLADYEPAPERYTATAQMFAEQDLDAAVICTPHHLHAAHAAEALEAGCHVLIEKPMVASMEEGRELQAAYERARAAAGEAGRPAPLIGVCFNPVYSPALIRAEHAIRDGRYGTLELITGYLSQNWMQLTAGSWRQERDRSGGGQAMDSGVHLAACVLRLAGAAEADESPPVPAPGRPASVYALVDNLSTEVDINSVITVRFGSGVLATLAIGGNSAPDGTHTSLIFERGRVDLDAWRGEWYRGVDADGVVDELADLGEASPDDNFLDAVLGTAELRAGLADGVAVAELMDAAYRSATAGAPVSVP